MIYTNKNIHAYIMGAIFTVIPPGPRTKPTITCTALPALWARLVRERQHAIIFPGKHKPKQTLTTLFQIISTPELNNPLVMAIPLRSFTTRDLMQAAFCVILPVAHPVCPSVLSHSLTIQREGTLNHQKRSLLAVTSCPRDLYTTR